MGLKQTGKVAHLEPKPLANRQLRSTGLAPALAAVSGSSQRCRGKGSTPEHLRRPPAYGQEAEQCCGAKRETQSNFLPLRSLS